MGRPQIEINWTELDSYLKLRSTKKSCALLMGVSEDTLERRINEKYSCTFKEYAEKQIEPVKLKLVQTALNKAFSGDNTMIIFCLKNLCGWTDKVETTLGENTSIQLKYNLDDKPKSD